MTELAVGSRGGEKGARGGFTLVELLTVIALIVTIAALAVPNFVSMMREQRMTQAINSIQVAIMRARTYAINAEADHSVEFCTDAQGANYMRIEEESAFLESIPNLENYLRMTGGITTMPTQWYECFIAHRDAWGPDGVRLYSGIWDCNWTVSTPMGRGHIAPDMQGDSSLNACKLYYDSRYSTGTKAGLTWPWQWGNGETVSSGERSNNPGSLATGTGYQDVDDDTTWIFQSSPWAISTRDNLAVDSSIYLPNSVTIVLPPPWGPAAAGPVSSLINYDEPTNPITGADVARHGWDNTPDLRFGKDGVLLQTTVPLLVLKRDTEVVRLQMLKGTGRLKKMF